MSDLLRQMRTIFCQLGAHWRPRVVCRSLDYFYLMVCDHCGAEWAEDPEGNRVI